MAQTKNSEEKNIDDRTTTLQQIKKAADDFRNERDWKKFHNPKDLGLALVTEVGELLEHFRYKTDAEIREYLQDRKNKKEIEYELADIMHLNMLLAVEMDIDISKAYFEKLEEAAKKYPVQIVKGKPHKYTKYTIPDEQQR